MERRGIYGFTTMNLRLYELDLLWDFTKNKLAPTALMTFRLNSQSNSEIYYCHSYKCLDIDIFKVIQ